MPKLSGSALLQAKASGSSARGSGGGRKAGAFTPLFGLKEGETTYLQFLNDELEEVFLHTWVRVPPRDPKKNTRGYDWEVFASRTRNAGFGDTYSVLEEELDHWPLKKIAGIAVLLDPVYVQGKPETFANIKSFEVAGNTVERDDGTIFYPRWQLVFEAYGSFWENLVMISNTIGIDAAPLQVTRVASDSYQFMPLQHVPQIDWDEYKQFIPSIEDEIKRLGSEERFEEYFGEGKPRIQKQEQRHNFLPQWIQDERIQSLAARGEDVVDSDEEEQQEQPVEKESRKTGRKSRVTFDDISTDDKEEVAPY